MGLKIVTGRTGTPHVTSNQIQAFNRSLLGDLAILDVGQHFDAVVRDANTVRIYDGCIVVQGIYAIIPHDEFEDILVEPVSVGNTRIDTIYLHYAKDMESDTESVELDIARGEEAVNNPVKPDIDLGGDIWEGETDIRVPLYDVTITSFDMTLTAYEYMNTYLPDISALSERIPENIVSGVKGNAEATFRNGNVNLTASNIGINANPTGTATDVITTIEIDGDVYSIAGGSESDIPMIAEAIKQWYTGSYTINLYGIGLPDTYYPASSTYSGNRYLDVATGIMYDCEQTGPSTYTWRQAPVNLRLKSDINASAIEELQEDITTSQTATGNPLTIESSESNLVECKAEVEAVQEGSGDPSPDNIRPIIGQTEVVIGDVGKNLLPMTVEGIKSANTDGTWNGNVYSKNNGTFEILTDSDDNVIGIKVNGTFNETTPLNLVMSEYATLTSIGLTSGTTYTINGCPQNGSFYNLYSLLFNAGNTWNKYDEGSGFNITVNDFDTYMIQVYIRSGYNAQNLIFYPMIRLATETDSNFEPYKGKTYRVEIGQKNKLPMTVDGIKSVNTSGTWSGNSYTIAGVRFDVNTDLDGYVISIGATRVGTSSTNAVLNLGTIPAGKYKVNGTSNGSSSTYYILDANGQIENYNGDSDLTITNSRSLYIRIMSSYQANNVLFYPMARLSTEINSEFVPYNPNLPSAIYGGELDVLTGELRVTHKEVDLGDLDYITSSTPNYQSFICTTITDIKKVTQGNLANILTQIFENVKADDTWKPYTVSLLNNSTTLYLNVNPSQFANVTDFKTAMSGQTLVYELAEPYTIQLTPEQIRLLKGTNNISCNTGDLTIKYYPDNVLGQLKGDIEAEIDAAANRIKGVKTMQISGGAVSTDGSIMFTNLIGSIIVGTSISNDANSNKCVGIPYSMGSVPALKIMNESTMSVLSNIHISGILYYIEL